MERSNPTALLHAALWLLHTCSGQQVPTLRTIPGIKRGLGWHFHKLTVHISSHLVWYATELKVIKSLFITTTKIKWLVCVSYAKVLLSQHTKWWSAVSYLKAGQHTRTAKHRPQTCWEQCSSSLPESFAALKWDCYRKCSVLTGLEGLWDLWRHHQQCD